MIYVSLDLETRSAVDLPVAGAYKYAQCPSTDVLCICWAIGDGEVKLWPGGSAPPQDLLELARDPRVMFRAFNVGFERRLWHFVLHGRYGWPDIPLERWHDTQADALACGFPGQLKQAAKALKVEFQKDASGTKLINLLSVPIKGTAHSPKFREKLEFPKYFLELYDYCKQDVRAERAVGNALPQRMTLVDPQERDIWMMTEEMNDTGIPIDYELASALYAYIDVELKDAATDRLIELTDGRVQKGSEVAGMNNELDEKLPNFQAETIRQALSCPFLSDFDREIMEIRQICGNVSTAKFLRMTAGAGKDNYVRDSLQYHGAVPGRWAGRGMQPQNFPRSSPKDADKKARTIIDPYSTLESIEAEYGPIQELAKSMLRPAIKAPYRKIFLCEDYSSVEACGTAWTTKDEAQLQGFRDNKDIYITTASDMYHVPYESIGKDDPERQAGKIAVLACGYQGGWKALRDFAVGYGIFWTSKESYAIVQDFRRARPRLVAAWAAFEDCAIKAINNPGHSYHVMGCQRCRMGMEGEHMFMELPNGKKIWFPFARMEMVTLKYETHEGEWKVMEKMGVTHMFLVKNVWVRRSIHGGSLFQSYVQAICREIMAEAMLRIRDAGYKLVMTVHDEVVVEVDYRDEYKQHEFHDLLVQQPEWAPGFPIKASGWSGQRYRK